MADTESMTRTDGGSNGETELDVDGMARTIEVAANDIADRFGSVEVSSMTDVWFVLRVYDAEKFEAVVAAVIDDADVRLYKADAEEASVSAKHVEYVNHSGGDSDDAVDRGELRADGGVDTATPDESAQLSIAEAVDEAPRVGVDLDTDAAFANPRYAARDEPGVIWYDPRDGHEYLAVVDPTPDDELALGEVTTTAIELCGHRKRGQVVDPEDEWSVVEQRRRRVERELIDGSTRIEVVDARHAEAYESVHEARRAVATEHPAYAAAEYRNAVEARVGSNGGAN